MKIDNSFRGIVDIVLAAPMDPFLTIWFTCHVAGGGASLSCFIQPKAKPKTVRNLAAVLERTKELTGLIMAKWAADAGDETNRWTKMTITIKANGEESIDQGYEDMDRIDYVKMRKDWTRKHWGDLVFVPDKR